MSQNIIKDQEGRAIAVYDDVFNLSYRDFLYSYAKNSIFRFGWKDTYTSEDNIYSQYSLEDMIECRFLTSLPKYITETLPLDNWKKTIINVSCPTDVNYIHTHKNEIVCLYYLNLDWQPHYFGETLFYEESLKEITYASAYTPGRVIVFDGEIPHSIRPHSILGPKLRFTMASIFEK